jgi:hypothetical protein
MRERGGAPRGLAAFLMKCFDEGRLAIAPDPFWTGPRFMWDAPLHLRQALSRASVAVFKGDANYRRLVGDAIWPATAPLDVAVDYIPSALVCIRTMKSDPILGVDAATLHALDASDPEWRINGQRGVIAFRAAL